jgi:hypothetical protein
VIDWELLSDEIRLYVKGKIHNEPHYKTLPWPALIADLTREALNKYLEDDLSRAIQSDRVEQIVVQVATNEGLKKPGE